jgi:hypothetical protein
MEASSRKDQADMGIKLGGITKKKRGQRTEAEEETTHVTW